MTWGGEITGVMRRILFVPGSSYSVACVQNLLKNAVSLAWFGVVSPLTTRLSAWSFRRNPKTVSFSFFKTEGGYAK
jgi:hypothetical protein